MSCRCGFSERQDFGHAGLPAWDGTHTVVVSIRDYLEEFSQSEYEQIVEECLAHIRSVCGLRIEFQKQVRIPHILLTSKRLDGPGGVLADMQLPPHQAPNRKVPTVGLQIVGRMDTGEEWSKYEGRVQRSIDVFRVLLHELGHGLGLYHNETGRSLMSPSIDVFREFGEYGKRELQARYGPPSVSPVPPDPGNASPQPVDICRQLLDLLQSMQFRRDRQIGGRIGTIVSLFEKLSGLLSPENLDRIRKIIECVDSLSPDEFSKKADAVMRLLEKERK